MKHEEQTLDGMRVRKIGRGRYECEPSNHGEAWYSVDILANDGLGECDCWDFRTRRLPRYNRIKIPFESLRCKHIRRVRVHVLDQILRPYIDAEESAKKPIDTPRGRTYNLRPPTQYQAHAHPH